MTTEINVDNIKCSGCAKTVTNRLDQISSVSNVRVDVESGKISFDYQEDSNKTEVISSLKKLGYPLSGEGSGIDKAKSYVSCMIGKVSNLAESN